MAPHPVSAREGSNPHYYGPTSRLSPGGFQLRAIHNDTGVKFYNKIRGTTECTVPLTHSYFSCIWLLKVTQ
jgi:hypothetical protein